VGFSSEKTFILILKLDNCSVSFYFVKCNLTKGKNVLMKEFLIEANRFLFSYPDKLIIKNLPLSNMKIIEYHRDNYSYRNYFTEGRRTCGQIIISLSDMPIWCMQFQGGVVKDGVDERTARHLKLIARKNRGLSDERFPIRGPRENLFSEYHYHNDIFGCLKQFQGQEVIQKDGDIYFTMKLLGGELK
jgi:hypothetical protein